MLFFGKDIDFIIWTGDLPPHDVWNQTRDNNLYVLRETVRQLNYYFPKARIFPALGNHESSPVNRYYDSRQRLCISFMIIGFSVG